MPGVFKLGKLQLTKPLLFRYFCNFYTFILGGQFWEKGILPTPKLNEIKGLQCLGHSNWTTCRPLSHFCSDIFPTFTHSYWGTISYYHSRAINGKGILCTSCPSRLSPHLYSTVIAPPFENVMRDVMSVASASPVFRLRAGCVRTARVVCLDDASFVPASIKWFSLGVSLLFLCSKHKTRHIRILAKLG